MDGSASAESRLERWRQGRSSTPQTTKQFIPLLNASSDRRRSKDRRLLGGHRDAETEAERLRSVGVGLQNYGDLLFKRPSSKQYPSSRRTWHRYVSTTYPVRWNRPLRLTASRLPAEEHQISGGDTGSGRWKSTLWKGGRHPP